MFWTVLLAIAFASCGKPLKAFAIAALIITWAHQINVIRGINMFYHHNFPTAVAVQAIRSQRLEERMDELERLVNDMDRQGELDRDDWDPMASYLRNELDADPWTWGDLSEGEHLPGEEDIYGAGITVVSLWLGTIAGSVAICLQSWLARRRRNADP
jgi:hypothetical protein